MDSALISFTRSEASFYSFARPSFRNEDLSPTPLFLVQRWMADTTESVGDGAFMLLSSGSESIYQSLEAPKRHHSVILDTCALNDFDNLRQTQRLPCHVIVLRSVPESCVEANVLSESLGYGQSQHAAPSLPQREPGPPEKANPLADRQS